VAIWLLRREFGAGRFCVQAHITMKTTLLRVSITAVVVAAASALVAPDLAYAQANARSEGSNNGGQRSGSGGGGNNAPATSSPRSGGSGARSSGGSSQPGGSNRAVDAAGSRRNDDNRIIGTAVARQGRPVTTRDTFIVRNYYPLGYSPWGYGGYGFGLGYGGFGFGYSAFGYDPWGYGGFYDPFYGYPRGYVAAPWGRGNYDGSLRLKVSPSDASVYVDGFYAGRVDDYDGMFQRLHLEPGAHKIEVRMDGYETLTFDVRILPDRTITYSGELAKP
jgi:hypothetical protein